MSNYSVSNFLIPLTENDMTVRLRDTFGRTQKLITDGYANITLAGANVHLKQTADSRVTVLDFPNMADARSAMLLLEQALIQLRNNKDRNNTGTLAGCENKRDSVLQQDIWSQSGDLPSTPPVSSTSLVQIITDLDLENIPNTFSFNSDDFYDIIPTYVGAGYEVVVKTSTGDVIPDSYNGMEIDHDCGVVRFNSFSNAGPYIINSSNPPMVDYYRYIGLKGGLLSSSDRSIPTRANKNMPALETEFSGDQAIDDADALEYTPPHDSYVQVMVNGRKHILASEFDLPVEFSCAFARKLPNVTANTTTLVAFASAHGLVAGDKFLVRVAGVLNLLEVSSVPLATDVNIVGTVVGTVGTSYTYQVRDLINATEGDVILWFGDFAGFELDTTDTVDVVYNQAL